MFALERRFHHRGHGEHREEKGGERKEATEGKITHRSPRFAEGWDSQKWLSYESRDLLF
jgi:hypothetical protein